MASSGALVVNPYLYPNLSYDPERAFTPIVLVSHTPLFIVGSKKLPITDFKGLIAYAKANPGKVNAGTFGVGSQGHITVGLLNKLAGISITHVPYRDYTKMVPDLLSNDLQMALVYMPAFVPQVQNGDILGLAVASQERSPAVPAVPSVTELGFADLVSPGWFALVAPSGTPRDILEAVNGAVNTYLKSEAAGKVLQAAAMMPGGGTADDLTAYLKKEHQKWGPILKESNITLQ
jgi:tripartite-type tricarboxylate transporter receptor subunit TctC